MITENTPTVFVSGGNQIVCSMFEHRGWVVVDDVEDADLVQFTGGSDVCPSLYKKAVNPKTRFNVDRDAYDRLVFDIAREHEVPMAGICRGAQFLHVMNGGDLYQHVTGHLKPHEVRVCRSPFLPAAVKMPSELIVSSTHHQMMVHGEGVVFLEAKYPTVYKEKEDAARCSSPFDYEMDAEGIYHKETRSLCFQPHPEYYKAPDPCNIFYFQMLKHAFGLTNKREKETEE